ncbi:MAG: ABC transporter ATP-binding protein, partial [Cohnella sp.]|nr:ABC transporter ATP-binding protein [Cohnella sp.]
MSGQQRHGSPPHGGPGRGPGGPGFGGMGGMGMPVQKPKNFKGTLRRLSKYLAPFKTNLIVVLATAILGTTFTIFSPKLLGHATTRLFEGMMSGTGIDFGPIADIIFLLMGLYLVSSLFTYVQQYVMAGVAQKTVYRLRNEVNEKLGRLPLKYYDTRTNGEILSRAVNDVDNISNTLQQSLTQLITSVISILGVIIMMFTISFWLTLIVLLTLPLSMI